MTRYRMRQPWPLMSALAAWLLFPTMTLAATDVSTDAARGCAAIVDDRARLACYDSLFGKPVASAPAAAPATASAATPSVAGPASSGTSAATAAAPTTAAATDPEADFGLTEAAKRAREPEQSKEELPDSITGTVAKVGQRPAGELVVTLDSGQVWTQVEVDVRARIAVGDTVTIKKAALGSFLLVTASRYATRVRRVK
jgi:hypothetical protein